LLSNHKAKLDRALDILQRSFPYEDYFPKSGTMLAQRVVCETVMRYLPAGSILDFGSGPCATSAALALSGYRVSACDDLSDAWHLKNDNRKRIIEFTRQAGIDFFFMKPESDLPYQPEQFDLVLINDVLEHLHDSPCQLLCQVVEWLKPGGLLLLTVPNAASFRKRVGLLLGLSNYPPYDQYFWYPSPWRGHVREYVLGDFRALSRFMHLDVVELRDIDKMVESRLRNSFAKYVYLTISRILPVPGLRDSLLLVARRGLSWTARQVLTSRPASLPFTFEDWPRPKTQGSVAVMDHDNSKLNNRS